MSNKVVVAKPGRTLRGDAAASYLRMIAAGMPTGGIDVYQRTMDEQKALYARYQKYGSPIAARPSISAPHIANIALDFQTTRNNKYTPSEAFAWITKGTDGSKAPRDTNDRNMRGHEYGWYRSVPSERWHLQYDAKKDKHAAADLAAKLKALGYKDVKAFQKAHKLTDDGIAGPLTWAALLVNPKPAVIEPEVPVTPVIKDDLFRVSSINVQNKRFGGGDYAKDAAFADSVLKSSVLLGSEFDSDAGDEFVDKMGYKVWPVNYVRVMWLPSHYTHGPKIPLTFNDKGVQGGVAVELTSKENGSKFVAASIHVRPNDAIPGTAAQKKKGKTNDVHAIVDWLKPYPNVVVGGDWSTESAYPILKAAGYKMVTPNEPTYKTYCLDSIWVKGNIPARTEGAVIKNPASDHKATLANLTIPAPKSLSS